jgi:sensor histidine kinase YesM
MFKRRWLYGLWLLGLCLALGLLDAFRSYSAAYYDGRHYLAWGAAVRWNLSGWLLWVAFIPLVLWLSNRLPVDRENWLARMLFYVPLGLSLSMIHTFFPILISLIFVSNFGTLVNWLGRRPYFLLTDFLFALVFYGFVLALGQARNYYQRCLERELRVSHFEAQLARAELQALKMQLHPHFLFNTLHSISSLQLEDVAAAQKMMARLGDFLRLTLDNVGVQKVTLQREIEFLKCYLAIEQVRFGGRLTTVIDVEPEAIDIQVPNLILQPLVENAIQHGIAPHPAPGLINISAKCERGKVKITICDNGGGLKPNSNGKGIVEGLGLRNTRARLKQFYGSNYHFEMKNGAEGGLVVSLDLPLSGDGRGGALED